jgi:hypothetical protein
MALVMSLFTGTVLAAVPAGTQTTTPPTTTDILVTAGTTSSTVKLGAFAATDDVLQYEIQTAGGTEYRKQTGIKVTAADTLVVDTSSLDIPTGAAKEVYDLIISNTSKTNASGYDHDSLVGTAKVDFVVIPITVIRTLTVNGATSAPKAVVGNNTFAGQLTYKGAVVKGMIVSVQDANNVILASVRTDDTGSFSLNVNFSTPAAYSIYVDTVEYYAISFDAVEDLKITVNGNPGSLRAANATQTMSFVIGRLNTSVPAYAGTEPTLVNVTLPNGTVVNTVATGTYDHDNDMAAADNVATGATGPIAIPAGTFVLILDDGTLGSVIAAGTYTVEVMTYLKPLGTATKIADANKTLQPARTAKTTFTIVDNTSTLFINKLEIGGGDGTASKLVPVGTGTIDMSFTAPGSLKFKKVEYTVTGPLKATVTVDGTGVMGNGTYTEAVKTVDVVGGGNIVVSGTVTYTDGTTDTKETFSKTLAVAGYVVEYSPAELGAVGAEVELKAVVTTADGIPVNNAKVTWSTTNLLNAANTSGFTVYDSTSKTYKAIDGSNNVVDGASKLIQNGTYSIKVKIAEPTKIVTTVQSNVNGLALYAVNTKTAYGAEVYTVKTAPANLIATKTSQIVKLELLDSDGNAVTPDYIYLENAGTLATQTALTYGTTTSITFDALAATGTFNIFLGTNTGNKVAKVPVTVVAPAVTVKVNGIESTKVTAGLLEKVELTFADTSNSNVYVAVTGVDGSVYKADKAATVVAVANKQASISGVNTIYTKVVPLKTATTSKIDVYVDFGGTAVKVTTLTVVQPTLTSSHTTLDVGTVVDLNLVLTDANGKGMKGYEIKSTGSDAFAGNAAVKTDENGKAILTVSPNAPGTLTLQIATLLVKDVNDALGNTDLATTADLTALTLSIPVQRDTKGPVFQMDAVYTVTTMPTTISFKVVDGSKVTEVWIGYEKALVRPDGSVLFTVTGLPVGVTEFDVLAYDYYGNASEATLVVEYLKPSTVVLTIGSTDSTRDGVAMTGMDQAPMIRNGRTFLPVRFVFVNLLGGTIQWDATTQTITSVVKGNTIKMVIGSKMAYVNGNVVTLLEAPFIEPSTSRTLVPMREIMEAIGISLDWNVTNQTVTLTIPQ